MAISTMLGYALAVVVIALTALVGFYSFEHSVSSYIILSFAILLIILMVDFLTKPSKQLPFCLSLSSPEVKAYQRYHFYLSKPKASVVISSLINALRFSGLVWVALAIWLGLYWQAGLCIVYFFVCADLIKKFTPWTKMGAKAEKGNKVARKQLYLIDLVQIKMSKYNEESLK
jgi:hypothetical protein